jgi:hypothetical protein
MDQGSLQQEHQLFLETLDKVLKRKLEDRILEMIDLPTGKIDRHIQDYILIAKEHGFLDSLEILERIVYEIGDLQISRMIAPQRSRNEPERILEDYLSIGTNLAEIELGLQYKGRQKRIKSGRTDIHAIDRNGKPVTIELKAGEYDSAKVHLQLLKYTGEQDHRVIFVAPEIKPDLYFALKQHVQEGRLSFVKMTRERDSYAFVPIDVDDFPEPEQLQWETRIKPTGPRDIIRIVSASRRNGCSIQGIKSLVDSKNVNVEEQPEDDCLSAEVWFNYPYHIKVMMLCGLIPEERALELVDYYTKPILCAKTLVSHLQDLTHPSKLEQALQNQIKFANQNISKEQAQDFTEFVDDYISKELHPNKKELKALRNHFKIQNLLRKELEFYQIALFKTLSGLRGLSGPERAKEYEGLSTAIVQLTQNNSAQRMLRASKNHVGRKLYHRILRNLRKTLSPDYKEVVSLLIEDKDFTNFALLVEFGKVKVARYHQLQKVDQLLARAYFSFSPDVLKLIDSVEEKIVHTSEPNNQSTKPLIDIATYILQDNMLYKEILRGLYNPKSTAITPPTKISIEFRKELEDIPPHPTHLREEAIRGLSTTILNGNTTYLPDDSHLRILYFMEDVYNSQLEIKQIKGLEETFHKFNFSRKTRKKEDFPSEIKVRNFFDDVTLQYVHKGKVPTKEELGWLYVSS